jgi:predicted NBD/HSP70 family sugar kinase
VDRSGRSSRSGRPPELLELNPALAIVGGIDFGHRSVRVAIADLSGATLAEARYECDVDNEASAAIATAADGLEALIASSRPALSPPIAVGAAISAPVYHDGRLVAAGILPGWAAISPRLELERRLGVPVHVGNDADLGALAEARTGAARGAADLVYLMLSAGVGGGLVLGGSLHTGHRGIAGELGHVIVDPKGAACRCGNRGCLETVAGAEAVLAAVRSAVGEPVSLAEAARLALAGDRRARGPFAAAGRAAGRVAGAVCNVVDPELVIVGGELIVAGATVVDAVRDGLAQSAIAPVREGVRVVAATLGDRAELLGAVGLAIAEADVVKVAVSAARSPAQ